MVFVVLGMHKSGTTLIAQTLHHSGIDMGVGRPDVSYDAGEQYERLITQEFNMEKLHCDQSTFSLKVYQPYRSSPQTKQDVGEAKSMLSALDEQYLNLWGFKDPRTCLVWPIWKEALEEFKLIAVWRDPREVLSHYVAKRPWYKQTPSRIIRAFRTLRAWYWHNQCILDILKSEGHGLLFNYANFMESEKPLQKMQDYVGQNLKDLRNKKMRRSKNQTTNLFRLASFISTLSGMNISKLENELKQRSEQN